MNFTSVLKAIGKGVATYSPVALRVAGGVAASGLIGGPVLGPIVGIVSATERAFESMNVESSGEDKMRAALPLTVDVIKNSELIAGKEIADENRFLAGAQKLQDGIVDILDSIKHQGPVGSGPLTPPPQQSRQP